MDKVYQVFISSTFSDLEGERKKVSDTLAKAGFIPSGMELRAGSGCLNNNSASISGASAGVRPPRGAEED